MTRNRVLIAAGVAAFLVTLLATAPATLLLNFLDDESGVAPTGVSGTLWSGQAMTVQAGPLRLDEVRWRTHPGSLLLGRFSADVAGKMPDGFVSGGVAYGLGGLKLSDLQAATPLGPLFPGLAGMSPDSQIALQLNELGWKDGWITQIRGSVRLAGLALALPGAGGGPAASGNYEVTFDAPEVSAEKPLTGALTDAGGPLELAGSVVLTPPRNYEINGTAKARPTAPSSLVQGLQMAGPKDAEGRHAISLAGSF